MNPLVQSCCHSPKYYDKGIWEELMVIPYQTKECNTPLKLFEYNNNPKAPHTATKNRKILKTIARQVGQRHATKM